MTTQLKKKLRRTLFLSSFWLRSGLSANQSSRFLRPQQGPPPSPVGTRRRTLMAMGAPATHAKPGSWFSPPLQCIGGASASLSLCLSLSRLGGGDDGGGGLWVGDATVYGAAYNPAPSWRAPSLVEAIRGRQGGKAGGGQKKTERKTETTRPENCETR
ncbi:hypothetical protein IF2G_02241 [Cordyceps javanica]|nr:hypothetical protein IF2G_02241 [Cordyceps javanica]